MPRHSLGNLSQEVIERAAAAENSWRVPLRVDFRMSKKSKTPGQLLGACGGEWDLREQRFVGPGTKARIWDVEDNQRDTTVYWLAWLQAFLTGEWSTFKRLHGKRPFSLWTVGGRRRGKTWLGTRLLAAFSIANPHSPLSPWLVSPIETDFAERKELHREWVEALPPSWYTWDEREMHIQLVNGVRILMYSAHDAEKLKDGAIGYAFWNEVQKSNAKRRGLNNLRGGAADVGTLVHCAANPPREPDEYWIDEILEGLDRGEIEGKMFDFRGDNPHVVEEALDSMRPEMTERDYAIERDGARMPRPDITLHRFVDGPSGNVRPRPASGEITERFLQKKLGRPFAALAGADFQRSPHQAATVDRFFEDPDDPGDALSWTVDEVLAEQGSENDLIDALEALGYRGDDLLRCLSCGDERVTWLVPERCVRCGKRAEEGPGFELLLATAVVGDASGAWQASDRKLTRLVGLKSFEVFRSRKWRHLYKPDETQEGNPHVDERVAVANERLFSATTKLRKAFIEPHCTNTIRAIKLWPTNKQRKPSRWSNFAHVGDSWTYPKHRLWPRIAAPATTETIDIINIHGRDDRAM